MKRLSIENVILGVMGTIAVVGLLCVVSMMLIGEINFSSFESIQLTGE